MCFWTRTNYFSNDTQCFAGRYIAYNMVFGTWPGGDLRNSRLVVMWGSNPPASHSYWTQDINEARDKGGKLIVVDTMYTEMARIADHYIQVKPGTDSILAWGLIKQLIDRDMVDLEFVAQFTKGFDELKEYARSFTQEFVSEQTGVAIEQMETILACYKESGNSISNWCGTGLEHQANGVNNVRSVAYIDALIGAVDVPGGMMTMDGFGVQSLHMHMDPEVEARAIGSQEFPILFNMRGECHTLRLMNQILSQEPYPFKGLIMTAANPVLTNANASKVIEAFKALDLLVVKELYMTETAELAHYVIPAASYMERSELQYNGINQTVKLTEKVVDLGLQNEYDFFKGLADRLGYTDLLPWENEDALNAWLIEPTGMSLEELASHRDGYQFAPLTYGKPQARQARGEKPFNTPSGLIEFTSGHLEAIGREPLAKFMNAPEYMSVSKEEYPLVLMTGSRKVMFFHGRYRNLSQVNKVMPEAQVEMHPSDAAWHNVVDGEMVRVTSAYGTINIKVRVMHEAEIVAGAVQITHGFKDANVNILVGDGVLDPISGFPALKSVPVRIEKIVH
ncbi:molybdopterin-dependent oxidoreductase [Endozoicomonas sp. SCSIO W0465]|uniref:molybdopterin-containing oxidoreductase family protein n=1 Tax=Endozoicomonas sp. SCSIO W0465 TaxID=2918516 RepID=UPI002075C947|nr:molybdopterin-dependent oxidoreductase [Endozoicomonas sp. SCSIO W0465]USE36190.1 molybdopterin-dependent oxidoreductase [Endozoicomonas sp. SCSIO W0465]